MDHVGAETKTAVIRDVAAAFGIAEPTLDDAWSRWDEETRAAGREIGKTASEIRDSFVSHLKQAGLVSERRPASLLNDRLEYEDAGSMRTATTDSDLARLDAELSRGINEELGEDELAAGAGYGYDNDDDEEDDDEEDDDDEPVAGVIPQDVIDRAEKMVIEAMAKEAASKSVGNEVGEEGRWSDLVAGTEYFDNNDPDRDRDEEGGGLLEAMDRLDLDYDDAVGGEYVDSESPMPAGKHLSKASIFLGGKAIAQWALRHRGDPDDPSTRDTTYDHGLVVGESLGSRLFEMDRKGKARRRRFPETVADQKARRQVVVVLLVETVVAAGMVSDAAWTAAENTLREIRTEYEAYGKALIPKQQPETSGARVSKFRRKVRALLNERDRRMIVSSILTVAGSAVADPGEKPVPGFGRSRQVQRLIRRYAREVTRNLRKNESAALAVVNFGKGALVGYIEHPKLLPFAPELVSTVDDRIAKALGERAYDTGELPVTADRIDTTTSKEKYKTEPTVSASDLAHQLLDRAGAFLRREGPNQDRYLLLIPEDHPEAQAKIRAMLDAGGDKADRYLRGALLARHPNTDLDRNGHLLSLSGTVFGLEKVSNADRRLRVFEMARSPHSGNRSRTQAWDDEAKNAGGRLEFRKDRVPMDCRVLPEDSKGSLPAIHTLSTGNRSTTIQPIYFSRPK